MDDEIRAIEIGNVYSYALAEGLPEDVIDAIYSHAIQVLEEGDKSF